MGSSTFLDIIGSMITFGLLLLMALRLNAGTSESSFAYTSNYLLQRNMVVLTVMLEDDLKHVGAGVYDPDGGVQKADVNDLKFRAFLPGNATGVPNVVEWVFEPAGTGTVFSAPNNTNIRYLDRIVDGVTTRMNLGVTQFTLGYWSCYNPNLPLATPMVSTTNPNPCGNIGPVSITIQLESPFKLKPQYTQAGDTLEYQMVWRQLRTISRNNSLQFPQ
jgi:hypothetical protein